jgi:hypothetical protein
MENEAVSKAKGQTLMRQPRFYFCWQKASIKAAGQTNILVVRQKKFYFDKGIDKHES